MKSFTLVEILVVTGIILLFTGMLLAGYNNFNQFKILEREASKLVDVLHLAKGKAQAGENYFDQTTGTYFDCSGSDEFGGYQMELNVTDYNFKQCCRDVATKNITACSSSIQSYSLPVNISITAGTGIINFYPLSGGASQTVLTIDNSVIGKSIDISISATGVIAPEDPI
ncbi:hypothetical protein A2954_00215 [Candidatus Roizmanbacteria bacterium RIFCSPLOWO2_01_FULL_37_12]|uniref:General secretion pathway GspH domain-containing protein n=1 Tax=Candidatus Roizmanbacteria bacterium RIFCSPLOWO2_01_FULL_37_12 TaxID=1802056 RepID=A0A1F7IB64_9BACT|nr:MAG: hypothetical protein A2768_00570 [Candidatus Roizmanbacteria bacterium RIFCSPHIGHO2_01_FULL_37_16]OGK24859.1 MAG: hypothetical protein A3D76_07055 [Candidatus Roizmanbacteria bacterium RIFCSPHIGHO2_02_FULL_37_9b]OGK40588.1 MAG: hypothetical protein A2954_00215 [Candidatus Roizmanbacteria bacterium RIFCSPLOWO2_01_FULL_37_12]